MLIGGKPMSKKDKFAGFLLGLITLIVLTTIVAYVVRFFMFSVLYLGIPLMVGSAITIIFSIWLYEGVIQGRSKVNE